jgi:hypothetical protein
MKVKSTEKIVTAFEPDKPYCSVAWLKHITM